MISVIIPVYNRPDELDELLASLTAQRDSDFEVVVVEDGSAVRSDEVVRKYADRLCIKYHEQANGGPASARNVGAQLADGNFLVILDSDTIMPTDYIERAARHIAAGVRFYGGADSAAADFSVLQRAISYSMTSLFTTGGIRGRRRAVNRFMPRSFNMGIERVLMVQVGGFNSEMRYGEDIDFSLRIMQLGVSPQFMPDLTVCHKRRNTLCSFFRQVYHFGGARIDLDRRHPSSRRIVYTLPALFTLGSITLIIISIWFWWIIMPLAAIIIVWFADASIRNRSMRVGIMAIITSFIQLYGYGSGYIAKKMSL